MALMIPFVALPAITKRANDAELDAAHAGEVYELAKEGNETAVQIMEDCGLVGAACLIIQDPS